jgi:RimJ/RimL family protein N-acetyltransferase
MLGATGPSRAGLTLPPGGVDTPYVIQSVRSMAANLRAYHDRGSWMVVAATEAGADEVVGLCSYKAPDFHRVVEIGYSIAESRRRLGHATRAVAALLAEAAADPMVGTVIAETDMANVASQRVLAKNGFGPSSARIDAGGREMILWSRSGPETLREAAARPIPAAAHRPS